MSNFNGKQKMTKDVIDDLLMMHSLLVILFKLFHRLLMLSSITVGIQPDKKDSSVLQQRTIGELMVS